MSRPSPGTEGYWSELSELAEGYTPEKGDLARIITHESTPVVYVLKRRDVDQEVVAALLADLDDDRVDLLLEADARQRESLVEPIRTSLERQETVELVIPDTDLVGIEELIA